MPSYSPFLLSALLGLSGFCQAHTVWLDTETASGGQYDVLFGGHAGALEPYQPGKLKSVTAYAEDGTELGVARADAEESVTLTLNPDTALVAIHFDNGIWSRDRMGRSVNEPMSEVPGATSATWAPKYHKTILIWGELATQPLQQAFEVTPLSASQPVAGEPMSVKVTLNGEPISNIRLGHGEEGDAGLTDADGIATFTPAPGANRLWAGIRLEVNEPDYTQLSYEYLLGFEALTP